MHRVEKSLIVPYPAEQMFELVADVGSYPQFVPGCKSAAVEAVSERTVEATLRVSAGPFRQRFTTRNTLTPPERIDMALVEGPFRALTGTWFFGVGEEGGTLIRLRLEFAFRSALLARTMAPAFGQMARRMVEAFAARAREIAAGAGRG